MCGTVGAFSAVAYSELCSEQQEVIVSTVGVCGDARKEEYNLQQLLIFVPISLKTPLY